MAQTVLIVDDEKNIVNIIAFNLKKEGRLFIVIQTKHGAKSHYTKLTTIFQTVNLLAKINSHWLIEAVK